MKDKIRYGNSVIEYTVVKSKRRKTSEIWVDKSGVEVRTPLIKKDSEIKKMVDNKKQWIFRKHLEFSDKIKKRKFKKKTLTKNALEKRVLKFASLMEVHPSKIIIKKLKGRWGSTTKDEIINLNIALTRAPLKIIDYIIIHELCHIKIKEHSFRFWNLVKKYEPDYRKKKKWLEENSLIINSNY